MGFTERFEREVLDCFPWATETMSLKERLRFYLITGEWPGQHLKETTQAHLTGLVINALSAKDQAEVAKLIKAAAIIGLQLDLKVLSASSQT